MMDVVRLDGLGYQTTTLYVPLVERECVWRTMKQSTTVDVVVFWDTFVYPTSNPAKKQRLLQPQIVKFYFLAIPNIIIHIFLLFYP
jgi:hypothetical protein